MGFYGNITNTSKTQFSFDKTYPNRYEMDNSKTTDGIYAGRYVLVEYDSKTNLKTFIRAWKNPRTGNFYTTPDYVNNTLLTKSQCELGQIIYIARLDIEPEGGYHPKDCIFYVCTSELIPNSQEAATFKETVNGDGLPNYTINYNIDTDRYGSGRGYDSTVWQKTYTGGVEKYIMIAELNSVVPTFDVSADAPTQRPLIPHFDTQSTDVYYKLHWQPSWGFRVKEKEFKQEMNSNYTQFNSSTDSNVYPSDEEVYHYTYSFNPETGVNEKNKDEKYAAAIFFNKAGFKKDYHTYYSSDEAVKNDAEGHYQDTISIVPTGQSGNEYNIHDGTSATHVDTDIQEMRILLPSLGNTISDIWDLIYGYTKKVSADEETTYTTDRIRFRDIAWKDAVTGSENLSMGGMTRDLETVAGCINKVHDLMGMIITTTEQATLNKEWFDKDLIYQNGNNYYRIYEYPLYETVVIGDLNLPDINNYENDQEYNKDYESAIKDILQDKEYFLIIKKSENGHCQVKTLNEKAISGLSKTSTIGYQTGEYGYEFVQIPGMPGKMGTIYGLILQMKKLLEEENSETRDTSTVTGAINALNDIIQVFEDLVPGEFLICDKNGHVNSANWTTKQDFSYENIGKSSESFAEEKDKGIENRWLRLSLNENVDGDNARLISLIHEFNEVPSTTTNSDKNKEQYYSSDLGNNNGFGDTLDLYTPIVDTTGHIIGNNIETVILPYGYKTFTTIGNNTNNTTDLDIVQDSMSSGNSIVNSGEPIGASETVANNTQDSLAVNPYNKWIQVKITDDEIDIAHEIHGIQSNPLTTDLNNKIDTIAFQDLQFDAAGHVTKNQKHTYTLPYGFKEVVPGDQSSAVINPNVNTETIIANNTQDNLTMQSSNKWIRMSANDAINTLYVGHEVHEFESGSANTPYGLTENLTIAKLDEIENNQFVVPMFKFDEAGHITKAETHTVNLPENFNKITIETSNDTSDKIAGTTGTIVADSLIDRLTLAEGNQWITIDANTTDDKITFSHYVNKPADTADAPDFNKSENGESFDVHELTWDNAGHIISNKTRTYSLPKGFKTIKIINTGDTDQIVTTDVESVDADLVADTIIDSAIIDTGNRWIQLVAANGSDKVTMYHAKPGKQTNTTNTTNLTPNYGKSFNIPVIKYDEAGHISGQSTYTVTFPEPQFNELTTTDGSVLTSLSVNPATLEITQTNANVGTRKLIGYTKNAVNTDVTEEDTINEALSKLQTQIHDEETARASAISTAINNLDYNSSSVTGDYISNITQTNGKISAVTKASLADHDTIKSLQATISTLQNTITTLQATVNQQTNDIADLKALIESYHSTIEENPEEGSTTE